MSDAEDADSAASVGPPAAQGQQVSAQQLQSTHPLWARARGQPIAPPPARGRAGAGPGGGGGGAQAGDGPRFEPLSALALELASFRANADGDSALFSEEGSELSLARAPRKRPRVEGGAAEAEGDEDEGGFSALADSEADDEERHRASKRKRGSRGRPTGGSSGHADAAMYAQAAFGGAYGDDHSDAESVSQLSGTSSARKRAAYKAAFPVKGIDCVGCALVKKIAPVEKFVKDHFDKMSEESLWKMAALTYVREVQEPRKREGVLSPDWVWKDLRTHFLIHCSDARIARAQTVRQLQTMRYCVEQRLMRVDNGEREVDRAGCDLMLKIIKEESAQRSMLGNSAGGSGGAAGGKKQPGGSTVGDAK